MICKNCGVDGGVSKNILNEIVCGNCGRKELKPVIKGQKRVFLKDIKVAIPYKYTAANEGDVFKVGEVGKIDTKIQYKKGSLQQLNTQYILNNTEVVNEG